MKSVSMTACYCCAILATVLRAGVKGSQVWRFAFDRASR